jgi:hypothetical protein
MHRALRRGNVQVTSNSLQGLPLRDGSRIAWLSLVAVALAAPGCSRRPVDRTKTWFEDHEKGLVAVRDMIAADRGLVTHVNADTASLTKVDRLHDVGGARGRCSPDPPKRGGNFPWLCTDGTVAKDQRDVEAFLGLPKGRLDEYANALDARGVRAGGRCDPPGSVVFWIQENGTSCTSVNDIIWSPAMPAPSGDPECHEADMGYLVLADHWYQHYCR